MRIFILCLTFIALNAHASACRFQGVTYDNADQLITHAESIYLVEASEKSTVINVTRGTVSSRETIPEIHFRIIETLKGERANIAPKRVYNAEEWRGSKRGKTDFNGHRDEAFWTEMGGRMVSFQYGLGLCGPDFVYYPGERYLMFPGELLSMKSAELIKSDDDKWLAYVRERLE